ncbi:hypothetical protein FEM03_12635 [Phragmitibacter flavus]|uniref:Uncharacterized protein n=1 Tax=Phragmitibacter flavus TaxID=2576071 RepID=A0A5R8KE36_9BACT|nr:hypothetical protein [Phragmitibacter flavus]TLD70562.1 hypothetical protein FEM03_12635 [Phragmitibacter flavus]
MKGAWFVLAALLVGIQWLGWGWLGGEVPLQALMMLAVPMAVLLGGALSWWFYRDREGVVWMVVLWIGLVGQLMYARRNTDSLFQMAMSEFLGRKVGGLEAHLGGGVFLLGLGLVSLMTAWGLALLMGRRSFLKDVLETFGRWDGKVTGWKKGGANEKE